MANSQSKVSPQQVKNVIIVGAGGRSGRYMATALVKTGHHTVTALTRPESKSTIVDGVKVVRAKYDDHAALINAMNGQDALVITMNNTAPNDSVEKLVNAAIEAGVPWILPNEWGYDYLNSDANRDTGLGATQLSIRQLIASKGGLRTAWIAIACGFWYDYSLAAGQDTLGFDFANKTVTLYEPGNEGLYFSTLEYCGDAVARVLSLPVATQDDSPCLQDYRNQIIRIHNFTASQADMLASVLRVTGDDEHAWTVQREAPEVRFRRGLDQLRAGDRWGLRLMLYARAFYPGNPTTGPSLFQDERLGLKPATLDEATRWIVDNELRNPSLDWKITQP